MTEPRVSTSPYAWSCQSSDRLEKKASNPATTWLPSSGVSSRLATITAGARVSRRIAVAIPRVLPPIASAIRSGEQSSRLRSAASALVEVHGLFGLTRTELEGHHQLGSLAIGTTGPNPFRKADIGRASQHRHARPDPAVPGRRRWPLPRRSGPPPGTGRQGRRRPWPRPGWPGGCGATRAP